MSEQLPPNWYTMTEVQQNANSIERYLHGEFPGFTFAVTPEPNLKVRVNEDGADVAAIQAAVTEWFRMVYGDEARVEWGVPVHVEAASITTR